MFPLSSGSPLRARRSRRPPVKRRASRSLLRTRSRLHDCRRRSRRRARWMPAPQPERARSIAAGAGVPGQPDRPTSGGRGQGASGGGPASTSISWTRASRSSEAPSSPIRSRRSGGRVTELLVEQRRKPGEGRSRSGLHGPERNLEARRRSRSARGLPSTRARSAPARSRGSFSSAECTCQRSHSRSACSSGPASGEGWSEGSAGAAPDVAYLDRRSHCGRRCRARRWLPRAPGRYVEADRHTETNAS